MDVIEPVVDIVKDVVPIVKKYVKYQICHNDYVNEFKEMQTKLERQRKDVAEGLRTQLMQPGKIAMQEVEAWLKEADQETDEKVVEDLICKGGCFTYICSSRKLDKRTQSLTEGIFKQGEKYTNAGESLVVDTPSIEYWATCGKIASMEVKDWLKKVGQQIPLKVEDLINRGGCSSLSNLRRKIEELKQIFEQGEKYTNAGESLVTNVDSIERGAIVFKEMQEQLKLRQKDIEAKLETSLLQPGKMASNEVKNWMEKASQQIDIKVEDLISQGECSSPSNLWKKIEELKQILEQGKEFTNAGVILVIDDHSIKGFPLPVEKCSGRDDIQEKILEWLKGDKVTRIAVSGMGGVGKTTIMKNQKKKFDILKFQQKIASSLKLVQEPDHENETKLAALISQRLGQGSFLLILDDVWEPFSLEDVGISNPVGNNGCKLVLTTRSKDVARAMDCNVIHVNPLPPDEALALFLEKIGSDVFSDGKIKRDMSHFLSKFCKNVMGYECLEPQCQECFLYCALYPEDYEIQKKELIEYWIEEGLIYKEGKTREAMNWKGHDILDKLVDNYLLELVGGKEYCLPEEGEWRENPLKLSLMENHITEIPSSMLSPKCPMLTTLLLSNNQISTIPEAFFEHMLGLKILDLSNNWELTRLPSSVSKLEKLTTLLLLNLGAVAESAQLPAGTFSSLQYINVRACYKIKKLFSLILSSAHEEENITLPKLQGLKLTRLPLLKSICNSSSVLICDSIQNLRISNCEKLKRIPMNFPLLDNAQSSHPPSLEEIVVLPKEWWESLEWDHPNAKDILFPFCKFQQKWW
ncbi:hypothetical protein SLEP1_g56568 [Rubroshorea leprosula]|uniref:NB-ARC domain-containing protein n=1 Tax=Rubroshorea leprosula TaxID=152421 RepID=A0AAV5MM34_9ROSI|nr:hypothetical protein SLEP1_g56568 [Rubroshorea leprosula]